MGRAIFSGNKVVGYYNQTSKNPTFDDLVRLPAQLSSRWLAEQSTQMAVGAAIAATGGLASGAFGGGFAATEVFGIGRIPNGVRVTFGHGGRHLAGTGIPQAEVEAAIRAQVQSIARDTSSTRSFWGKVAVRGREIVYRAFTRPDGSINIGTYTAGAP